MVKQSLWSRLFGSKLADPTPVERFTALHTKPIGSAGTESYSGYPAEDYLDKMRGTQRADLFDQIRRSDPQVKMCLSSVKNPIKAGTFSFEPGDNSDEAKRDSDLMNHIFFNDMDMTWKKFLDEALTFIEFGHSVFEITHKVVLTHPEFGAYNGIKYFNWRSPRTIDKWNLDPQTGELVSIEQQAYGDLIRLVTIPSQYLVVFAIDKEGANYEGISWLRPCYGCWLRKNTYLKLNAIGIEKFAIPTPLVEVPSGKEDAADTNTLEAVLQSYTLHQKNYLFYPQGYKIDLKTNTYDPSKVEASIDAEDKRMVKAFLANFLELGTSGTGAYALSNDLSDFFLSGLDHIALEICETLNNGVVKQLIDMNRGPRAVYPKLKASGISDRAGKELAEMYKAYVESKIITPDDKLEENIRRRIKAPAMDKTTQRQTASPAMGATPEPQTLAERIRLAEWRRITNAK